MTSILCQPKLQMESVLGGLSKLTTPGRSGSSFVSPLTPTPALASMKTQSNPRLICPAMVLRPKHTCWEPRPRSNSGGRHTSIGPGIFPIGGPPSAPHVNRQDDFPLTRIISGWKRKDPSQNKNTQYCRASSSKPPGWLASMVNCMTSP
jgi:hypothetical protein